MPETRFFLEQALRLAEQSLYLTAPNPHVGCVLTSRQGQVIGQGHTQRAGQAHAEIMALRDAAAQGTSPQDATAYVTLEPCAHQGRTGPCCDTLIAAGIEKVVCLHTDPNPLVAGQGLERLRAAGVAVELWPETDPLAIQARELNIGFFSRMTRQLPWVRMKMAASLDGHTALPNGLSQWITSSAARTDGHAWRARACAVLTGIGTVLADNPKLNVRLINTPRQPTLVVVDSRLETPLDAALFIAGRALLIYAAVQNDAKKLALEARGAQVIYLPGATPESCTKVDLKAMLHDLAQREINELHVEAGFKLNGSFIRAGLVDEFLIYLAPKLLGAGAGMANFGPLATLDDAVQLHIQSLKQVGPDVRLVARWV